MNTWWVLSLVLGVPELSLQEALQRTLQTQPSVRQAEADRDVLQARQLQTRGALLPQLSANAQYSRSTANFAPRPGAVPTSVNQATSNSLDTFDFFSFGATLNQQIYDFHQTIGRYQAASLQAEASSHSAAYSRVVALQNTRLAYMTSLASKALVRAAEDNLANVSKQLEGAKAGAEVGRRPMVDVLQAQTLKANAVVDKIRADNTYRVSRVQLARAMGESSSDFTVKDEPSVALDAESIPFDNLVAIAEKDRLDIQALNKQMAAQQATIVSQRGRFGPSLSASAGVTESGRQLSQMVFNLQFGAQLTWNLFSGLTDYHAWNEAEATLRSLQARKDALVLELRATLEQAVLDVQSALEATRAADEALAAANERFALAQARYETGVGNALEQADAQAQLTNAKVARIRADLDVATARARLLAALGREA